MLGTGRKLATLMERKLGGLQLIAVMIDGVRFADHVVLAAVGIDTSGKKHVLGLREGATENVASCKARLADLIERGLATDRARLFRDRRRQGSMSEISCSEPYNHAR